MGYDDLDTRETKVITVDHHYFDNLEVKLIAGRNFNESMERNKRKIILNESALGYLGFGKDDEVSGPGKSGLEKPLAPLSNRFSDCYLLIL